MSDAISSVNGSFPQTKWSLVVSSAVGAEGALNELCQIYWKPIYTFLRRSGYQTSEAEDLTQSFFEKLLRTKGFSRFEKGRGKLRSFLLGALKRHVVDCYRHQEAAKRGGGAEHVPLATSELDFEDAEHEFAAQPVDEETPDRAFDQRWALEILSRAHQRIRESYEKAGKAKEYELLKAVVATVGEIDYEMAAKALGVKTSYARVLAHRLRKNFRAAAKEEIAETVSSLSEVDGELRALLAVFK